MLNRVKHLAPAPLAALALLLVAAPARAQSDVLLQLRSGSPFGDRFRVDSAGGFVAIGGLGIGIIPASGAGYRTMWHPFRAAFRSGQAQGTEWDDANIGFFSWAGGTNAKASQTYSFAFGNNVTSTAQAAVVFGNNNDVSGSFGFSVGSGNNCNGIACVAMGNTVNADGNSATAIGYHSTANADYSTAIGYRASTFLHTGATVISDASTTDSTRASANNQLTVRAAGGTRIFSNATMTVGVNLAAGGGSWTTISDRNLKRNFLAVDGEDVLRRLRAVPVSTWSYKTEDAGTLHMGPMAQDWHVAFGFNADDRSINTGDFDGVNLAAIKGLDARTERQEQRIHQLEDEVAQLRAMVQALSAQVAAQQTAPAQH